jgi:HAD superfamily hydrolase (TIGR01509 family)
MNQLQALIFDVDGTLANTERDGHRIAFNHAFAEQGLDWHWSVELYGELLNVTGGKERIKYYLDRFQPNLSQVDNVSDFIVSLHQLKNQYYQTLLKQGAIPLRPGVKRIITEAKERGIRLAIATTSTLPNVITLLEKAIDPNWFEIIAAGDIVPQKKPAPDIYVYVLEQMNLAAENCLVFEDSHHGLQAATQAGLKTIVTVNNYTEKQDFKSAILVVNHLGEPNNNLEVIQGNLANFTYIDLSNIQQFILN